MGDDTIDVSTPTRSAGCVTSQLAHGCLLSTLPSCTAAPLPSIIVDAAAIEPVCASQGSAHGIRACSHARDDDAQEPNADTGRHGSDGAGAPEQQPAEPPGDR